MIWSHSKVNGMPVNDMPEDISKGYEKLIIEFSIIGKKINLIMFWL